LNANLEWCLSLQNDCCGVSTESGSDRVTILEISGDPVATALGTDLILKLRHHSAKASLSEKSTSLCELCDALCLCGEIT